MRIPYHTIISSLICIFLFGGTENAWALQSHGAPEGIYVHQMAHILFMASLSYLYWHTRRTPELKSKGWKYLQIFCFLLISWNILAFTGHYTFEHLTADDFIYKNTWDEQLVTPITFTKALYFITKMDHFLMVPALFALTISLRTFYMEAKRGVEQ